jgi:hypothetical protein
MVNSASDLVSQSFSHTEDDQDPDRRGPAQKVQIS